jgi:hypothetical protein
MKIEEHIGKLARISISQATYLLLDFKDQQLRVNYIGKEQFHLVRGAHGRFEILTTHPLLLDYNEPWGSTYINSPAPMPESFCDEMPLIIDQVTAGRRSWLSYTPKGYLPHHQVLLRNLKKGNGLLLNAPKSITEAIVASCRARNIQTVTFYSEVTPRKHKVLFVGNCFVIAEDFIEGY